MTDLFNSPVLLIEQPNKTVEYQITDPQGVALAHAGQVGGEKKGWFQRNFAGDDMARLVVQVTGPDGAPLFFVDRAAGQQASPIQPPCAIVAPDGSMIGRAEHNTAAFANSFLQTGGRGTQQSYRLVDASGQPLCEVVMEPVTTRYRRPMGHGADRYSELEPRTIGGRFAVFTDMNGVQIAHVDLTESGPIADRFTLQIGYQLPDPLRVLVIAAPIAIDLMNGA